MPRAGEVRCGGPTWTAEPSILRGSDQKEMQADIVAAADDEDEDDDKRTAAQIDFTKNERTRDE